MDSNELEDTARIDRRNTVLAQLEAALLAGRLELSEEPVKATGTNPYDRGARPAPRPSGDQWGSRRR